MNHLYNVTPETLSAVRKTIRDMLPTLPDGDTVEVVLASGLYTPDQFVFDASDCSARVHIIYRAEEAGKVTVSGGKSIPASAWTVPDADMASRFSAEARPHIKMLSLTALGLTRAEWGEEIAIGSCNTAHKYDDAPKGCGSEFFTGERRMTKARYPNLGEFAKLDAVADVGDVHEFPPQNYYHDWNDRRNHRGGTYVIDREMNRRVMGWRDPSTAWMFGYFYWDWADSSTPVTFKTENRLVFPKFVSHYSARAGAHYYFYNIPEELDTEGEWYLDRETGNVYFWPHEGAETADFSYSDKPLISCRGTCNMTFAGLVCTGSMGDAVRVDGNHMTFDALTVKNVAGNAIVANGSDNTVRGCDISRTGRGGITLSGGDRATLTPGRNRATNNYVHDFAEIYLTYQGGINLHGVGNVADHNEICRAPHSAMFYSGNENIIEYNDIHDVVLLSSDAGAIYAGYDWAASGNIMRYNRLENIGGEGFAPDGIYWDDGLSGQTAYGNIFINVKKWSIHVGGGRDCVVENNIVVDSGHAALHYDDRNRDAFVHDGWAREAVNNPEKGHWAKLKNVPYTDALWAEKYPRLASVKTSFETDPDDPDFPINPAYSSMKNNIIIAPTGKQYDVSQSVYRYSDVRDNPVYDSAESAGWSTVTRTLSADSVVYRDLPDFAEIPFDEIGRK